MLLGFAQHLVALAPGVLRELAAVLLRIGDVLVRHLLGVRQDPHGLDVGVLGPGTGRVTGGDDAPPQALDLLPQRCLLVQQGHELLLDLVTERMHGLLVEAATAEPGRRKADRLHLIGCQPTVAGGHGHGSLQPKSSRWIWLLGTPRATSWVTVASTIGVGPDA